MQFKILDELLHYLATATKVSFSGIRSECSEKSDFLKSLSNVIIYDALHKLVKDGYAIKDKQNKSIGSKEPVDIYYISFEGRFFIIDGGYEGQMGRNHTKENEYALIAIEQRRQARQIVYLNWVIAVGTAIASVYAIVEILKTFGFFAEPVSTILTTCATC